MILTGSEISRQRVKGSITIEPFELSQINPNSYNYRLGSKIGVPVPVDGQIEFQFIDIPPGGFRLGPMRTYLGHTFETLGSDVFAMSLIGRSSLGRLGLFLQVSANLGHTGTCHQWTLELVAAKPIILYAHMRIGQISFWMNEDIPDLYQAGYSLFNAPTASKIRSEVYPQPALA
jgi:dCTP deaminase